MSPLPMVSTVVAFAAALGGAFWWPRRPLFLAAGAITAAVVSVAVTVFYRGPASNELAGRLVMETIPQLWVVVQAIRRPPTLVAAAAGTLTVAAIGVSPFRVAIWLDPPASAIEVVVVCGCWTFAALVAAGVGIYLRWLDRERSRSVAAAQREQRVQLARDLHDWLAHEMTGIVLAAQAGRLDPADSARTFQQIEDAGVRGLEAMDRALRLLRDASSLSYESERPPTLAEIAEVAHRFPGGPHTVVEIDELDLRPEVVATVHRVVVESLTNVRRHASSATEVRISVASCNTGVCVVVRDNGRSGDRRRRGGSGLTELSARVEALGGVLTAGPVAPVGWAVRVEVPV